MSKAVLHLPKASGLDLLDELVALLRDAERAKHAPEKGTHATVVGRRFWVCAGLEDEPHSGLVAGQGGNCLALSVKTTGQQVGFEAVVLELWRDEEQTVFVHVVRERGLDIRDDGGAEAQIEQCR